MIDFDLDDQCPFIDLRFGSGIFIMATANKFFDFIHNKIGELSKFDDDDVDDNDDNDDDENKNDENKNDENNEDEDFYPLVFGLISIKS